VKGETRTDGRRERSEPTRRKLLAAAAERFGEAGYAATTLEHVAEAAGVNKALVRYHFGGKLGLYNAVVADGIEAGRELLAPVRALEGPAVERLHAFVDALRALFVRRPHFGRIIVREWMSGGAHIEPEVMAAFLHFFQTDREILEAGVRAGELRRTDPHAAHLALVGSLVFFEVTRPLREGPHGRHAPALDPETFHDLVKDLLRRGLTP